MAVTAGLQTELEGLAIGEAGTRLIEAINAGTVLISDVVDSILRKGVKVGASDIHIEPTGQGLRVRYRIDGVFHELGYLPVQVHEQVVARVKVLADLISHKREVSQEGRIRIVADDRRGDFRVSIVPTVSGERVVLRMFNPTQGMFDLEDLGYPDQLTKQLKSLLADMKGMVIVTGPAGSGKTSAMYSALKWMKTNRDKYASICSIEDPVEYNFGVFAQLQVNRTVGLDFATLLSAVLRQDPQVIMIGEIRDHETCEIALHAGLTGHLVLSTIHSSSACETVARILNMGVERFVCAAALSGVVAQRLLRKVCEGCAQPEQPSRIYRKFLAEHLGEDMEYTCRKGRGCKECGYTGYRGRLPVAEILVVDDDFRAKILEEPSSVELKRFAESRGMKFMLDDALTKVAEGKTTLDEVLRVVSVGEERILEE